jgi:hypothetical protein
MPQLVHNVNTVGNRDEKERVPDEDQYVVTWPSCGVQELFSLAE